MILINKLLPSEWEVFRNIRLAALQTEASAFGSKYEDFVSRPESYWKGILENPNNILFVAEVENKVVGMVRLKLDDDEIADEYAYLGSLYVDAAYRGQGIAKALIESAEKYVLEQGGKKAIFLEVYASLSNVVKLYKSLGYKVVQRKITDGVEDLEMVKQL